MTTALVLGATGLIGRELLAQLANDAAYETITSFVRRPSPARSTKVLEIIVDYDKPETYQSHLAVEQVFCCLGTTIKKAGSQAAFRRVDLEIPLHIANASLSAGAKRYLVVTAVGSDAASSVFYNRVKGELEDRLRALPFSGGVKIFRPSLLLGERDESRVGEQIASVAMAIAKPFLAGSLQRYRAIHAADVARAMIQIAKTEDASTHAYEGAELFAAAGTGRS